jgi:WD40 repeat protein
VKLWNPLGPEELLTLRGHSGSVNNVVFSPDGTRLASASDDHTAVVWSLLTKARLLTVISQSEILAITFGRDGKYLATASADKTATIRDAYTGRQLHTLNGHLGYVGGVAFSPSGELIATAGYDGTARLWSTLTGQQLLTFHTGGTQVQNVVFSPDGRRIATAEFNQLATVWDVGSGKSVAAVGHWGPPGYLYSHVGWGYSVWSSVRTANSSTAGIDGTARVWRVAEESEVMALRGCEGL